MHASSHFPSSKTASASSSTPALNTTFSLPFRRSTALQSNTSPLSTCQIQNTKLCVSLDSSAGIVPLRLSSSTTTATFFENVTKALGCEERSLEALQVGFDWLPEMELVIRKDLADTFEEMPEIIGEATCWEGQGGKGGETGKCVVRVRRFTTGEEVWVAMR
ncbi:MAG: hypothetical protein MMC33_008239 [Icmadophila ericetorum]|nr:hypothetical protein [Icmadophila ericetorum]